MAGLYIHIPFCKQACHYCDFHFSTKTTGLAAMVMALQTELHRRSNYLNGQAITSIYFGGGTPSLLDDKMLGQLLDTIHQLFDVQSTAEITLEANPDDLHFQKTKTLRSLGINRLSIGVQSFDGHQLQRMNRAHTASEAESAIKGAQDNGLENITADLIFALPDLSAEHYAADVRRLLSMGVQHLSAYGLTVEPRTVFHKWASQGQFNEANAQMFEAHFRTTPAICAEFGLQHYEVSNFGLPTHFSQHNSAYWKGAHYLGIGPSAHSYNGHSRQWNWSNNPQYMRAIAQHEPHWEIETIDAQAAKHEYIMTGLRTIWGIDLSYMAQKTEWSFGNDKQEIIADWISRGLAQKEGSCIVLTIDGWLQVDRLTTALFDTPH